MADATATDSAVSIRERVDAREWYHSIELAPGLVTPGWQDCRTVAQQVLPARCDGLRCLDIGTFDGFWAFEMERRGASEVVAIDILDERRWDWPARTDRASQEAIERKKGGGDGFVIAKDALGSRVERLDLSVYDLDPREHGEFDLVYLGSLLLHLRDPVRALERIRAVCRGTLVAADAINLPLTLLPWPIARLDGTERPYWWEPNRKGLARMVHAGGFDIVDGPHTYFMPAGAGLPKVPVTLRNLRSLEARELIFATRFGDPHAWLRARPVA
jgi:tRNA (mo5U34)-methyltransferase